MTNEPTTSAAPSTTTSCPCPECAGSGLVRVYSSRPDADCDVDGCEACDATGVCRDPAAVALYVEEARYYCADDAEGEAFLFSPGKF